MQHGNAKKRIGPVGDHAPTRPKEGGEEINAIIDANLEVDLPLFVVNGSLEGRPVRILIDSGASSNFVDRRLIDPRLVAGPERTVRLADGTPGTVHGTVQSEVTVGTGYHCSSQFKVMQLSPNHQVILGQAWLTPTNPRIDWASQEMDITVIPGRVAWVRSVHGVAKPYQG